MRTDRASLRRDFDALAAVGRTSGGGLRREAYTPAYLEARELVRRWMDQIGLRTRVDAVGNILGTTPAPGGAVILTGSHIDAVPDGGVFDGAAGVIAAVEAVRTIVGAGVPLKRPLEVVAFTEEEGRFKGLLGSAVMTGVESLADLGELRDPEGISLAQALASVGLDIAELHRARRSANEIAAFVELHVEQGAVLEQVGIPVGIVTAIAGTHRLAVEIKGRTDHAGATPMDARRDALLAAAEVIQASRRVALASGRPTARATVGQLFVEPNVTSAVPGRVRFVVDVRDVDAEARKRMADEIERAIALACSREKLDHEISNPMSAPPGPTDAGVRAAIEAACRCADAPFLSMVSGASHDAQNLAAMVPTGMIFVPSRDGRSHSPSEFTEMDQLALGTDVLISTLLHLAAD